MIKKAVIPAAGYGTRSLPVTKTLPKEMFPIGGRPAIDFAIEEAEKAGIEEVLIILSRSKTMIMDYFDRSLELETFLQFKNKTHLLAKNKLPNVQLMYMRQTFANGLGGAIKLAKSFVGNDPFAVILPDEIIFTKKQNPLKQMSELYKEMHGNVIGVQVEKESELKNYGVISGKQIGSHVYEVNDIVEKPKVAPPSHLAIVGRYILRPEIFPYLTKQMLGVNSEYQLTDALAEMARNEKTYAIELIGERYDIGKYNEYVKLLNKFMT